MFSEQGMKIGDQFSNRGFSLFEMLVAMTVFSVGMLAIASMLATSSEGNNAARGVTEAMMVASIQMERLMSLPHTDPDLNDTDGDGTDQDADADQVDDDGGNFGLDDAATGTADRSQTAGIYKLFWNVAVNKPTIDTKTIRIIVSWSAALDGSNGQKRATLDFIRADL
ncbi:MAG: prepilin-type N-terminal cleavage/methylation domain-containing protein [Desulfobacterales bacterium]|nr:MAG: prepilin-type N-terminal cleavage/methylation domain-containing protein [Desulfobacterales bacterium]